MIPLPPISLARILASELCVRTNDVYMLMDEMKDQGIVCTPSNVIAYGSNK